MSTHAAYKVVWPGVTVWPDWFNSKTQAYWNNEFALFFNPQTGLNVDGIWIGTSILDRLLMAYRFARHECMPTESIQRYTSYSLL